MLGLQSGEKRIEGERRWERARDRKGREKGNRGGWEEMVGLGRENIVGGFDMDKSTTGKRGA